MTRKTNFLLITRTDCLYKYLNYQQQEVAYNTLKAMNEKAKTKILRKNNYGQLNWRMYYSTDIMLLP